MQRGDYVIDTVSGRTLIFLERRGASLNPHCFGAELRTLDGHFWVKRMRQLRKPMVGEIRSANRQRRL